MKSENILIDSSITTSFFNREKHIIDEIYKKYSYTNIDKQEYKEIVYLAICDALNNKRKMSPQEEEEYFKSSLQMFVTDYINKLMQDEDKFLTITTNYFKENILNSDISTFDKIKKIKDFFESIDFIPTVDSYIALFNSNSDINELVEKFVNKNLVAIKNGNIKSLEENAQLMLIIESYCMNNGIELYDNTFDSILNETGEVSDDLVTDYFHLISNIPLLTRDEEKTLAARVAKGDMEAKDIFVERNLRLVVSIARRYRNCGMDFMDLIQEGNLGLVRAVEKFDASKGYKFSTYATSWITQYITRSIKNKERSIRIPIGTLEKLAKYNSGKASLINELGREPTIYEIKDYLKIPLSQVEEFENLRRQTTIVSLNSLVGDDTDEEFGNFIADTNFHTEDKALEESTKKEVLRAIWNVLSPREIEIITFRFGFITRKPQKLEEVAKKLGITRERVRQIENKALLRLGKSEYKKVLANHTDDLDNVLVMVKPIKKYVSLKAKESLYETYKEYDKELIDAELERLSAYERQLIKCYYQREEDLRLSTNDYQNFFILLGKIRERLAYRAKKQAPKNNINKEKQSLYDYFSPSDYEKVSAVIKALTEMKDENFLKYYQVKLEDLEGSEKREFYNQVILKIRRKLNILNSLGREYTISEIPSILLESEMGHKTKKDVAIMHSIYDYFPDVDKKEIDLIIERLAYKDKKTYKFYRDRDLEELDEKEKKKFYSSVVSNVKKGLVKKEDTKKEDTKEENIEKEEKNSKTVSRNIYDYFRDVEPSELDEIAKTLNRFAQFTYKEFLERDLTTLSSEEKRQLNTLVIIPLRKYINKEKNIGNQLNIYSYFKKYDKEEVDNVLMGLKDEEREVIELYNRIVPSGIKIGENITEEQYRLLAGHLLPSISKKLSKARKEASNLTRSNEKNDLEKLDEFIKSPAFLEIAKIMPKEEALLVSLNLGFIKLEELPSEEVIKILNIPKDEAREKTKEALTTYREYIKKQESNNAKKLLKK